MEPPLRLASIDSRTFGRQLKTNPLLIVPVGALEAHGPHLPLGADEIQAEATAVELARRVGGLVAPTIPYGSAPSAAAFPGTVSLDLGELTGYVAGVLRGFAGAGLRRILVLSGHAERGHMAALREAAARTMRDVPTCRIVVLSDYDFVYERRGEEAPASDGHAGALETSRLLFLAPATVGPERPVVAGRPSPFVPGPADPTDWPESVIGDTRPANPELGERLQQHVLRRLSETVEELLPA